MSAPTDPMQKLRDRARAVRLPPEMVMGAATAAYQIEGATAADGRGESIWDRFSHMPGATRNGDTGDLACDHYHRWPEDLALMRQLNLGAYRFSIAWPRIFPSGRGALNEKGLDFYDALIDALLDRRIVPYVTLYHWDLPQALQNEGGGWLRRGIVDDFLDFADAVTRRLGDRVHCWTTFNEPWTFTWPGYGFGEDAPGLKLGAQGALAASHHALLAHGKAVPVIRANAPKAQVGIVLDLNVASPASERPADIAAARRFDGFQNRWYLDPIFRGSYPDDMMGLYGVSAPSVMPGDMAAVAAPIDYLGINVYRRSVIADGDGAPPINYRRIEPPGVYTLTGWEVYPPAVYDILAYVQGNYGPPALYITENGAAFVDRVEIDGSVMDTGRAEYMVAHLEQVQRAIEAGIPLRGYFAWTLMDNFEWAYGFDARFGLIHVDFKSQRRRIKLSGELYGMVAGNVLASRSNGLRSKT